MMQWTVSAGMEMSIMLCIPFKLQLPLLKKQLLVARVVNATETSTLRKWLHDEWGIGQEVTTNVDVTSMKSTNGGTGVLAFLSVQDCVIFISVGGALDHCLTNGQMDQMINDIMKEDMKGNDCELGLEKGIEAIVDVLEKGKEPSILESVSDTWFNMNDIVGLVLILFVIGNGAFHQWKRKRDQRICAKAASKL